MEAKKQIRKKLLAKRALLSCREQFAKSNAIFLQLQKEDWFQKAEVIFCYIHYHEEVQTEAILTYIWSQGKTVAVPKVMGSEMKFYSIATLADLELGYKGIREPSGCECRQEVIPDGKSLMLVPGVGFDRQGNRCGYGKGFYDRYLEQYPELHTIALAYDCQVCASLPVDFHDRVMDQIITESQIINTSR